MQSDTSPKSDFISIGKSSEYLGVSIDTLRRWEKREKIKVYRSPGGHRYFKKEDLDKLFGKKYTHDFKKLTENKVLKISKESEKQKIQEPSESKDVKVQSWIIDRPPREVAIPQTPLIRVVREYLQKEENALPTLEVLTPPPILSTKQEDSKSPRKKFSMSNFVIVGAILLLIVLVILMTIWQASPRVISPIP